MRNKVDRKSARRVTIALATCVGLSACAAPTKPRDAATTTAATQVNSGGLKSADSALTLRHRAMGEGTNYEWGKDHLFVKLSSAETGGALTLIQDNLKPGFDLGLHLHRAHAEIFYILDGEIEFTVGDKAFTAIAGAVVYVPAGTPHAAKSSKGGRMLMFYAPGGFDEMLAEINDASWLQRLNPFASARRDQKYDIHKAADGAPSAPGGPKPRYLAPGDGKRVGVGTNNRMVKLGSTETDGLATMFEEVITPGVEREPRRQSNRAEIVFVLDGEVEFQSAGMATAATVGATIYFPPGVASRVTSHKGAKTLVFRTPGDSDSKD